VRVIVYPKQYCGRATGCIGLSGSLEAG
jgi:hypothetical protein